MPSSADRGSSWRHVAALPLAVVILLPLAVMVGGSLRQAGLPPPRTPELPAWPLAWGELRPDGGPHQSRAA